MRLPGWLVALQFGFAAACLSLTLCIVGGTILSQQVLVAGAKAEWAAPALATMLGVLGSFGPVGFFNETPQGAIGLGVEAGAMPWVLVTATPMVLLAWRLRLRAASSRLTEIFFALGYGLTTGFGVGLLATWAVNLEPNVDLPVSPDLVAGRSMLVALVAVSVAQLSDRLPRFVVLARPVFVGGLAFFATVLSVWSVGLIVAIATAPSELRQSLTTVGALIGGNLTTASFLSSVGVSTDLTIRSGLTGSVDEYSLAEVTGVSDVLIALIGTTIVMAAVLAAYTVALQSVPEGWPPIWPVLGVAFGFAGGGAAVASALSGNFDLVILPIDPSQRTFSEISIVAEAGAVFTQLGARALFIGLPFLLFGGRRVATQRPAPAIQTPAHHVVEGTQ